MPADPAIVNDVARSIWRVYQRSPLAGKWRLSVSWDRLEELAVLGLPSANTMRDTALAEARAAIETYEAKRPRTDCGGGCCFWFGLVIILWLFG